MYVSKFIKLKYRGLIGNLTFFSYMKFNSQSFMPKFVRKPMYEKIIISKDKLVNVQHN